MLYSHSADPILREEDFQNPGSEYRGAPFWAWNCKLDQEELLRQLDVMKTMGFGGAHMHARTGMETPYLSNEHMALVKACIEKCRQEHMLAWLYDEDRWPSGFAGGLVTKDPQFRARHLLFTATPYDPSKPPLTWHPTGGTAQRTENGTLLACYDIVLDENGCLASANLIAPDTPAVGRKWYAYAETAVAGPRFNNQTYVNTMEPKAIQRFLETTYDRYYAFVGDDFGDVVPAIFADEPQLALQNTLDFADSPKDLFLPWTTDLPETFRTTYGTDLLTHLPELIWNLPQGQYSPIRYQFHDHTAERFARSFADTCGKWCQEHGILFTGHLACETTLAFQTRAIGEAMRSYRSFQLPGIDMLCNHYEYTTAKQAQSAVHQYGREGLMSELDGVTGWTFDFRGHKLHGDWQAALGVTLRVPHLSLVSLKGEAKRDYPASINYQSPWWEDYAFVEDHFARICTALTRGNPLVKVAVIHPIESFWLHWGPAEQCAGRMDQIERNFQDVTRWLLTGSIDFDFISEALLPELCTKGGAPLQVGEMAYDAVVVPGCETLRTSTLERLETFRAAGGKLIFLGDAPTLENAMPSDTGRKLWEQSDKAGFSQESLLHALQAQRMIEIRNANGSRTNNLLHQLRRDGNGLWLFVAHGCEPYNKDIPTAQHIRISLKGTYQVTLYDTLTGNILPIDHTHQNSCTIINATLYDYDSLLLHLEESETAVSVPVAPAVPGRDLPVSKLVSYRLSEPNVYLMDKAEFALDDGDYRPELELLRADHILRQELGWPTREQNVAQPWVVEEPTVTHSVRLRFTVESAVDVPNVKLATEDAELAEIRFNGQTITAKPDGWFTDKSIQTIPLGTLPQGISTIEICLPFGQRTNVEWCYLLGDFGVYLAGEARLIVARPEKLGFDSVVGQMLPHYGGNIAYELPVETHGGRLCVTVPHYAGAAIRVSVDGQTIGHVAYPPYKLDLGIWDAGHHTITLTLLGTRENCFGPLHMADLEDHWIEPQSWRTTGAKWTDSYRVKPLGICSKPIITEY